jgi:hypothetical protein
MPINEKQVGKGHVLQPRKTLVVRTYRMRIRTGFKKGFYPPFGRVERSEGRGVIRLFSSSLIRRVVCPPRTLIASDPPRRRVKYVV